MKLELKAKHFEGTEFVDWEEKCAIEKAYDEATGGNSSEYIHGLKCFKFDKNFRHKEYGVSEFGSDKFKAQSHNWDETVIRTIELTEV